MSQPTVPVLLGWGANAAAVPAAPGPLRTFRQGTFRPRTFICRTFGGLGVASSPPTVVDLLDLEPTVTDVLRFTRPVLDPVDF